MEQDTPRGGEAGRKAREAFELHMQGFNLGVIAERVGYANRGGAWKAVRRGERYHADELGEVVENGRARAHARYLELFREACAHALSREDGAVKWMTQAIKLADRIANLEGVTPPEQTVRVTVQDEVDREIAELAQAIEARAAGREVGNLEAQALAVLRAPDADRR